MSTLICMLFEELKFCAENPELVASYDWPYLLEEEAKALGIKPPSVHRPEEAYAEHLHEIDRATAECDGYVFEHDLDALRNETQEIAGGDA